MDTHAMVSVNLQCKWNITYLDSVIWFLLMLDVDECELEHDECQQICGNTPGSYVCGCYFGFTLSSDRRSCRGKLIK